jgi:hypothetical protein
MLSVLLIAAGLGVPQAQPPSEPLRLRVEQ